VFAAEMFLMQVRRDAARFGVGSERLRCHGGDFFYDHRHVAASVALRPTKGGVTRDQHGWLMQRIEFCKSSNDGVAGVRLVVRANLRRCKRLVTGMGPWK